jgi:hypothetical protein
MEDRPWTRMRAAARGHGPTAWCTAGGMGPSRRAARWTAWGLGATGGGPPGGGPPPGARRQALPRAALPVAGDLRGADLRVDIHRRMGAAGWPSRWAAAGGWGGRQAALRQGMGTTGWPSGGRSSGGWGGAPPGGYGAPPGGYGPPPRRIPRGAVIAGSRRLSRSRAGGHACRVLTGRRVHLRVGACRQIRGRSSRRSIVV